MLRLKQMLNQQHFEFLYAESLFIANVGSKSSFPQETTRRKDDNTNKLLYIFFIFLEF